MRGTVYFQHLPPDSQIFLTLLRKIQEMASDLAIKPVVEFGTYGHLPLEHSDPAVLQGVIMAAHDFLWQMRLVPSEWRHSRDARTH